MLTVKMLGLVPGGLITLLGRNGHRATIRCSQMKQWSETCQQTWSFFEDTENKEPWQSLGGPEQKLVYLQLGSCWKHQCVQFEEFLQNRIIAPFHLFHGSKEARLALVQKHDPVREFAGEPHIVRYYDAGQVQLGFE